MGEHHLNKNDTVEQLRDVRIIATHEDYNDKTYENDIALLVLGQEVHFDNFTQPIRIPNETQIVPSIIFFHSG